MWRSLLFIPILNEKFLDKAAQRGADAIVLDLEASIPESRKAEGRSAAGAAVDRFADAGVDIFVRINPCWTPAFDDLQSVIRPGLRGVVLPLCQNAAQVVAIDGVITELERSRGLPLHSIALIPMVETPAAAIAAREITQAAPRIAAVTLGTEDYATAIGAPPTADVLTYPATQIIQSAKAAGISPLVIPGSIADVKNMDAFEQSVQLGRKLGSEGGFAVHPKQVELLNHHFSPTEAELELARRIVAAAESARAEGQGVAVVDGMMIDLPVEKRARAVLSSKS